MRSIPTALTGRTFTRQQALDHGVTDRMLAGRRFVRIHPGVYRLHDTPMTFALAVEAALLKLPSGSALSHLTGLRHRGLSIGPVQPLHVTVPTRSHVVLDGVRCHRYLRRPEIELVDGVPLVSPRRTFVDCAVLLGERQLLQVGDWLVAQGLADRHELWAYAQSTHYDGVQRARRVAPIVRAGVASPRESDVRWHLVRSGLPEPEINAEIHDEHGSWLARGDLVYREWKVLVEYDGWQHERDAKQRQWDHLRREQLEAAGWRAVVVTTADMSNPDLVTLRVRQALRSRGCPV